MYIYIYICVCVLVCLYVCVFLHLHINKLSTKYIYSLNTHQCLPEPQFLFCQFSTMELQTFFSCVVLDDFSLVVCLKVE